MKRHSQHGVALVITLIMLSVITFLAIAFLILSQRERASVTGTTDQTIARLAADTAAERATAELLAPILARTNPFAFDLLVSTNYVSPLGYNTTQPNNNTVFWPTNVSYTYPNGQPVRGDDFLQNLANLFFNPRPPVFIVTNRNQPTPEFRYYIDLNRNGRYDTNGAGPELDSLGNFILDTNNLPLTNFFVGDPEWIGLPERPELPHSATNKFIARYAYYVLPAGKALDLNYVHNQAKMLRPKDEGFLRNQGVGTWEVNLAAFLADLNTNRWNPPASPYTYITSSTFSKGTAFSEALSLLRYRYSPTGRSMDGDYNTLQSANGYFGGFADALFRTDNVDEYANGPLMVDWLALTNENDNVSNPWSGADNTNHFFTTQELFDAAKTSTDFTNSLLTAGAQKSSYDRYTFYRLLAQMGTDSGPEPAGKINLNFNNVTTNAAVFVEWTPLAFFTNAADKLLRTYYGSGFTLTNISLYPTNNYSPNVHRLLQLAANLYDATTNRALTPYPHFPSVFRPIFRRDATGKIMIAGYREEQDDRLATNPPTFVDLNDPASSNQIRPVGTPINPNDATEPMVYGVPVVIGAKKGFPNFNEFALQTIVQTTRKLQFRKQTAGGPIIETNQMYTLGISNRFAVEAWNSYGSAFTRPLEMRVANDVIAVLSNEARALRYTNYTYASPIITSNSWPAYVPRYKYSFSVPLRVDIPFLTNSIYRADGTFVPLAEGFDRSAANQFPVPQWRLWVTNRLRFILVDKTAGRIVDYVNLTGLDNGLDITGELMTDDTTGGSLMNQVWATNRVHGSTSIGIPTDGIIHQIAICLGNEQVDDSVWRAYNASTRDKASGIAGFRAFRYNTGQNTNLVMQAPFNPARQFYLRTSWQANDPLVHYMTSDLTDLVGTRDVSIISPALPAPDFENIGWLNTRYRPWGGNPNQSVDTNAYNLTIKDPLVRRSDDWDFPTNKFPNVGWLGRVHRGTPWQTVYLKPSDVDTTPWQNWTGNTVASPADRRVTDALWARPVNDWSLLDLFTTAPNENATSGQLSVNQPNLAAWSAVLSGVLVLTNSSTDAELNRPAPLIRIDPWVVEPAGVVGTNSPLWRIVDGINRERIRKDAKGNFIHRDATFWSLGEILSVPELTVASPFLNLSTATQTQRGISDAVYERIPQQIFSLLRATEPRFVVYAYGQALKPADRSLVTSGSFFGLCTNYQITAEVVTRSVVRLEGPADRPTARTESFNILPPD